MRNVNAHTQSIVVSSPEPLPQYDGPKNQDSLHVVEENILQERKIGILGAISLIVNKIVGAG